MKIAIFESEHFEVVYPLIRLFDTPGNNIVVFTNRDCYQQLQQVFHDSMNRHDWVIRDKESVYSFIYNAYKRIKQQKIELVFLSTISNHFIYYYLMIRQLEGLKIIMTLHDINSFLQFKPALSLRRLIRIMGKRLLMREVKEFNVIAKSMVAYLETKLPAGRKVYCLPGSVFEPGRIHRQTKQNQPSLQVVVPGSIDEKRRDYQLVFDLLEFIRKHRLNVHITLLGIAYGNYGKNILQRARAAAATDHLKYYETGLIDQQEYDQVLSQSDLVFIPSVIHTIISDGIMETYGISKSSGTIFDAVRHAKPFMIPQALAVDDFLEPAALRYHSTADIFAFIERAVHNPEWLMDLKEKALAAAAHYTAEAIRSRNPGLFPVT